MEQGSEDIDLGVTDKKLSHPSLNLQITIPDLQSLPSSLTDWGNSSSWKQSSGAGNCRDAPAAALTCRGMCLMSCSVSRAQTCRERAAVSTHTSTASPTTAQEPCRAPSHGAATLTCTQTQPAVSRTRPQRHPRAHSSKFSQLVLATAEKNDLPAWGLWDNPD